MKRLDERIFTLSSIFYFSALSYCDMFLKVYPHAIKFLLQTLDLSNFSVCDGDAAVFRGRRQPLMKLGSIDYCCMRLEETSEIGHFRVPPGPRYQNEVRCSTFDMKMIFHSHANKTHFHKKS